MSPDSTTIGPSVSASTTTRPFPEPSKTISNCVTNSILAKSGLILEETILPAGIGVAATPVNSQVTLVRED